VGEIVRVLKWRLDLDAAGMADGIEKAATSAERLAKSTAEIGEKGGSGLKKVSAAAKETETAFEGMGLEAKQVEMYLGRLEKGAGSPLVLQRNAELAQAALSVLATKAEAAGSALDSAFTGRVEEAIRGAKEQAAGMNAELEKMGGQTPTKLDKVITALEKTESSAAGAWAAIEKMGQEGAAAAAALAKMEAAADSPRELQRNAALAEMAMNELRQSIDRATASGAKIGSDLGGAMSAAAAKIEAANNRAAKMRDTLGDMKTRGDLAAKGMEATAGAAGSLEGMLGRLNDTGGASAQTFAKVGFAVVSVGAAFEMGYNQGEKLRAGLTALGVQLPDLSAKTGAVVVAIESMVRGYEEAELVESAAMSRARQIIALREQQARAEQALAAAMSKSGLVWKDANAEREAVIAKLNAAEFALARVAKSEAAWTEAVKVNTPELQKLRKEAEEHGIALDKLAPRTAAAAAESDKYATSAKNAAAATREATTAVSEAVAQAADFEKWIQREAAAYDDLSEAVTRSRAAESASKNFSSPEVEAGLKRIQDEAVGAAAAAGEFGTSLDTVAKKVVSLNGQLTVQQQIWLSVAMASDKATDALYRQIEATRKLSDQQKESLDAARGWSDYIIALKEGYESGVTSLGSYIQQLVAFKSQLEQMFAGVSGAAADSLNEMIQLIETLLATAGAGGPTSAAGGYKGQFERNANKGK